MKRRKSSRQGDYEVGYGKPPIATRFKKGTSGNPHGRPRGPRTAGAIMDQVLNRKVTVRDRTGPRQVAVLEAVLLRIVGKALEGDARAARQMLALAGQAGAEPRQSGQADELSREDREVLEAYVQDVRKKSGESA